MYDPRILEKKLEDSATKSTDFAAEGELTVTITVHEYRKLVEDSVKSLHTSMELNNMRSELNRLQIKYNELCRDRCDDLSRVETE